MGPPSWLEPERLDLGSRGGSRHWGKPAADCTIDWGSALVLSSPRQPLQPAEHHLDHVTPRTMCVTHRFIDDLHFSLNQLHCNTFTLEWAKKDTKRTLANISTGSLNIKQAVCAIGHRMAIDKIRKSKLGINYVFPCIWLYGHIALEHVWGALAILALFHITTTLKTALLCAGLPDF